MLEEAPRVLEGLTHIVFGFLRFFEALDRFDVQSLRSAEPRARAAELGGQDQEHDHD